jgi:hypothetical protein
MLFLQYWGCRTEAWTYELKWKHLESCIEEGDNPVHDLIYIPISILSSAGHEESCVKPAGPSVKAKYSPETDSEPVP